MARPDYVPFAIQSSFLASLSRLSSGFKLRHEALKAHSTDLRRPECFQGSSLSRDSRTDRSEARRSESHYCFGLIKIPLMEAQSGFSHSRPDELLARIATRPKASLERRDLWRRSPIQSGARPPD